MYDTVLVPTDGSDAVDDSLEHALSIAADNDATVHALYVVDTRIVRAADDDSRDNLEATLEAEGEEAVTTVLERATEAGVEAIDAVRHGTPPRTILEYAEEVGADLIVIGPQGKTAREKVTSLGSVSERVVSDADRPVLVVRT